MAGLVSWLAALLESRCLFTIIIRYNLPLVTYVLTVNFRLVLNWISRLFLSFTFPVIYWFETYKQTQTH